MEFFFPDAQDMIDPSFDFKSETRAEFRVRQRDDKYAHEIFEDPPFDGILVSKAIVDGAGQYAGKYSLAQRHRLLRLGIRDFLRAHVRTGGRHLKIMGDCGAFSYRNEEVPPVTVEEVVHFYSECRFDLGISVDHVITKFNVDWDSLLPGIPAIPAGFIERQRLTLDLADGFLKLAKSSGIFTPLGVAQGWSPLSYAHAVESLQKMGYDYIAIGGMVPLKTDEILATLSAITRVRKPSVRLHLLGVTRVGHIRRFRKYGVVSFDSTSPFLQAFKDARDNYHTATDTFSAVRVPQVEDNPKMQRRVRSGQVDQNQALKLERACLTAIRRFDRGEETDVETVLDPLVAYEMLHADGKSRVAEYRRTLEARPWKSCPCEICRSIGVEVVIFRGSERNKRRGFHNLTVFWQKLHGALSTTSH